MVLIALRTQGSYQLALHNFFELSLIILLQSNIFGDSSCKLSTLVKLVFSKRYGSWADSAFRRSSLNCEQIYIFGQRLRIIAGARQCRMAIRVMFESVDSIGDVLVSGIECLESDAHFQIIEIKIRNNSIQIQLQTNLLYAVSYKIHLVLFLYCIISFSYYLLGFEYCTHNSMYQNDHRTIYTIQQAHEELNRLADLISHSALWPHQHLVAYIEIFITMQNQSEEFFASFCQHEIIQKVFPSGDSSRDTLQALQLFNLILANTNQVNNLIYLFSQPALHSFLFQRFNIEKQSAETVEYYVQLLKAVIMKMSIGHPLLIKLFCNNRYSSFPLLFQITYLAVNAHEELVKITAQQCVLLLINLLNKKKVGCGYLSEIQMAVFYHQLTISIGKSQKDLQGGLKYLVDLIVALQKNVISLHMLLNAFTINILYKKMQRVCEALQLIRRFSELMCESQQLDQTLYQKIRLVLSRIVCNFCFSRFLSSTYITSITKIIKNQFEPPSLIKDEKYLHTPLLKYFTTRFQKILPYIEEFDKKEQSQNDLSLILEGWIVFNGSSQVTTIKQNKQKLKSSIFGFFSSKPSHLDNYLKAVTMSVGMNYASLKYPLFKLSATVDFSTAIYIVQSILAKQQLKVGANRMGGFEQYEIHFNDNRGGIQLNEVFCSQLMLMLQKIQREKVGLQKQSSHPAQFQVNFIVRLKEYLCASLSDHLLLIQHDYSIKEISMLNRLLSKIKISESIQRKTAQKLLWKLEQIQVQINQLIFKNDFKSLIGYIIFNQYQNLLLKNKIKSKEGKHRDNIVKKMFKYEFIREILDPEFPTLRNFVLLKWRALIKQQSNASKLSLCKYDKDGRLISIKSNDQMKFTLSIEEEQKQAIFFQLQEESIFEALYQKQCIYFSQHPQGIHFKSKRQSEEFKQQWIKISGLREQIITKSIVEFFQATHNHLCSVIAQKRQEKTLYRNSKSDQKY